MGHNGWFNRYFRRANSGVGILLLASLFFTFNSSAQDTNQAINVIDGACDIGSSSDVDCIETACETYLSNSKWCKSNQSAIKQIHDRKWRVVLPTNYNKEQQLPLLIDFHGTTGSIDKQLAMYDIEDKAIEHGFVLVILQGLKQPFTMPDGSTKIFKTWNADFEFTCFKGDRKRTTRRSKRRC